MSVITAESFRIRSALPRDVAKLMPYFSFALQYPSETRLFVIEDQNGNLCGGGFVISTSEDAMFDIHVIGENNFESVATPLLNFFEDWCRARGVQRLLPSKPVPENSPMEKLLQERQFQADRILTTYEVETSQAWNDFEPAYQRL